MKTMEPLELVKQPQDVTESPYRRSDKDKTEASKTSFGSNEEVQKHFEYYTRGPQPDVWGLMLVHRSFGTRTQ